MSISTLFTRIMNLARLRIPGALDDTMKYELFAVLDEFFQFSDIWREAVSLTTVVGQTVYEVEPEEAGGAIVRLLTLVDANGNPFGATMYELGTLVLNTIPTTTTALSATISLTVTDPTRSDAFPVCPEWILQKYWQGLLGGLFGKMMSQPAKPYSNETLAVFHSKQFAACKALARVEARTANLNGGQAWRYPKTFA